ncbi:MAG: aminoglycoside phosphotransferase family protein, partial [Acidobacteriota bacterium]
VELQNASTGEAQSVVLFGKTYYNNDGAETFARMRQLSESETCLSGRLTLAQPLAYQPEIQTLWQMGLPGVSLYEREADGSQFFALLESAAVSLAALHQTPISCSRDVGIADLLARFDEVERMVAMLRPELSSRLRSLLDRLRNQARQIDARPTATLHGDLHLKNFFVTGQKVALIDLDNLCVGDPLQELGSFIASLFYRSLAQKKPAELCRAMADVFVRAYSAASLQTINRSILDWHVAAALIAERAFRCVTRLKSDRPSLLEEVIALADKLCTRKQFVSVPSFIQLF